MMNTNNIICAIIGALGLVGCILCIIATFFHMISYVWAIISLALMMFAFGNWDDYNDKE